MSSKEYHPSQAEKKRLFFALWPEDSVLVQIQRHVLPLFAPCQGRILQPHNWHITLAYFGMADSETQACLEQQAESIIAKPFELELQVTGFWSRPQVGWLAPKVKPQALVQLAQDLQQSLVPCGYTPETREYQPHVTLVRKAKHPPSMPEVAPIKMQLRQFCLVESETTEQGAEYTIVKTWDL